MGNMSDRLRQARQDAGFSSASAAAKVHGWTVSTYIAHENGQNRFDTEQAGIYAKAFKVRPEWLLLGQVAPDAGIDAQLRLLPPDDARALIDKFNSMIEGVKLISKRK